MEDDDVFEVSEPVAAPVVAAAPRAPELVGGILWDFEHDRPWEPPPEVEESEHTPEPSETSTVSEPDPPPKLKPNYGSVTSLSCTCTWGSDSKKIKGAYRSPPVHPTAEERLAALRAKLAREQQEELYEVGGKPSLDEFQERLAEEDLLLGKGTAIARLSLIGVKLSQEKAEDAHLRSRVASLKGVVSKEVANLRQIEARGFAQAPPSSTLTQKAERHLQQAPDDMGPARGGGPHSWRLKAPLPKASRGASGAITSSTGGRSGSPARPPRREEGRQAASAKLEHSDTPYIRRYGDPRALVAQSVSDAKAGRRSGKAGLLQGGQWLGS